MDRNGDCDTFSHFLKRAEIVHVWYSRQTDSLLSIPSDGDVNPPPVGDELTVAEQADDALGNRINESTDLFMVDFFAEMQGAASWMLHSMDDFSPSWGD
jgi:hypothetical protein